MIIFLAQNAETDKLEALKGLWSVSHCNRLVDAIDAQQKHNAKFCIVDSSYNYQNELEELKDLISRCRVCLSITRDDIDVVVSAINIGFDSILLEPWDKSILKMQYMKAQ